MICILDTETSGLPSNPRARVVELGAIVLDPHSDYSDIDRFGLLFRPRDFDVQRDGEGLRRSGIDPAEVESARSEAYARKAFGDFLRANNAFEVYSYNRVFDEGMLKRSGFSLPWKGCVMDMARKASGKKNLSLHAAAELFLREIPVGQPHRALPDAMLASLVFAAIRRRGG